MTTHEFQFNEAMRFFENCGADSSDYSEEGLSAVVHNGLAAKGDLFELLGMNVDNGFRIILESDASEPVFIKEYPVTTHFLDLFVFTSLQQIDKAVQKYSIFNNTIRFKDENCDRKLSRVLTAIWDSYDTVAYSKLHSDFIQVLDAICTHDEWNSRFVNLIYTELDGRRNFDLSRFMLTSDVWCYRERGFEVLRDRCIFENLWSVVKLWELYRELVSTAKNTVVLSGNIFDYLSASTFSSFSSCFEYGHEWFCGTINNWLSTSGFIMYSIKQGTSFDKKVGRIWTHILTHDDKSTAFSPLIVQQRKYGTIGNLEAAAVRKYIQQCMGIPSSYWKHGKRAINADYQKCLTYVDTGYRWDLSFLTDKYENTEQAANLFTLRYPDYNYCVSCGVYADDVSPETGCCRSCADMYECEECGCRIREGNEWTYNDNVFCHACYDKLVTICPVCGEAHWDDDTHSLNCVEGAPQDYCCSDCYDSEVGTCDVCGQEIWLDASFETDDAYTVCEDCYNKWEEESSIDEEE